LSGFEAVDGRVKNTPSAAADRIHTLSLAKRIKRKIEYLVFFCSMLVEQRLTA
jgi:hypothetical protein